MPQLPVQAATRRNSSAVTSPKPGRRKKRRLWQLRKKRHKELLPLCTQLSTADSIMSQPLWNSHRLCSACSDIQFSKLALHPISRKSIGGRAYSARSETSWDVYFSKVSTSLHIQPSVLFSRVSNKIFVVYDN